MDLLRAKPEVRSTKVTEVDEVGSGAKWTRAEYYIPIAGKLRNFFSGGLNLEWGAIFLYVVSGIHHSKKGIVL